MIKIELWEDHGWIPAIRGMRNPMNSWEKSDSKMISTTLQYREIANGIEAMEHVPCVPYISIGENDHDLMMKLRNAGTDHRKYMRMLIVWVDITAPIYWWKEFDTYKVGTVANSCSTMHKIHAKELYECDFSFEDVEEYAEEYPYDDALHSAYAEAQRLVFVINKLIYKYNETKDYKYWRAIIQLLPSSFNQKRTIMFSYENLASMYKARKNHKLDEWRELCKWMEDLPYSEIITGEKKNAE